ncbi:MAG TPA: peptidylprolyl isomerase [Fimbriiglobus sp.]|nr:peptidylprolyl isomerase [Fimbriiglobus sp.]
MSRWLCALLLVSSSAAAAPPTESPVAATVNGEAIRLDEVDAVIRRMRVADGPLSASQVKGLRQAVVQDLIDDVLLRQHMRKHGPKVEPAELDKHMAALATSLRRQGQSLAEYCRAAGRTEAQVRDAWATLVQFQRYVDQQATDEKLRKYHAANKPLFDRAKVRVRHIVIRVGLDAPPTERAAARQKLAAIRSEIAAGKLTFADAARKYSISASAPKGGDLGFIGLRDPAVDEAVGRAAFALKPGEVSEPIDGEYGVHLVQAAERTPGTPVAFEKVADLVRECYAEDVRQGLVGLLRKQATIAVTLP